MSFFGPPPQQPGPWAKQLEEKKKKAEARRQKVRDLKRRKEMQAFNDQVAKEYEEKMRQQNSEPDAMGPPSLTRGFNSKLPGQNKTAKEAKPGFGANEHSTNQSTGLNSANVPPLRRF